MASAGDEGRVSCPVGRLRARRGGQEARFSTRLLWPVAWVFAGRCVRPHAPGSAPWVTARCPTVSPDPTWRYLAKDRVLRRDTGPPFSFLATCLPVWQRWATQADRGRRPPPPSAAAVAPRCPPLGHAGERGPSGLQRSSREVSGHLDFGPRVLKPGSSRNCLCAVKVIGVSRPRCPLISPRSVICPAVALVFPDAGNSGFLCSP